jgi:hypothetical protein
MKRNKAENIVKHMSGQQKSFLDYVQQHERSWGDKLYPGRPSLASIMASPIVVFWRTGSARDDMYKITLHDDMAQVEKQLVRMLIAAEPPNDRINMIFQNQKKLSIVGVSIHFREV